MIKKLPAYYRNSQVIKELFEAISALMDKMSEEIDTKCMRLFISTTDEFDKHERDVGLAAISADNETKRSRVIARLQGKNPLTVSELEALIRVYEKTGCTIIEDCPNYTVTVFFSGRTGIPYNLEQIKAAIEEVKPAHIEFLYAFSENTWDDVKAKVGTWEEAKEFTWDGVRMYDGRTWLYVDGEKVYLQSEDGANAYVTFDNEGVYAKLL